MAQINGWLRRAQRCLGEAVKQRGLWCGWGMSPTLDGVKVFNPDGKPIGFIAPPERAANVCFGGRYRNVYSWRATRSVRFTSTRRARQALPTSPAPRWNFTHRVAFSSRT
jgi:hypothetical protein